MGWIVDKNSGERRWENESTADSPPIDIENPDELRKLAKNTLVMIIQGSPKLPSLVPAVKELLDRVDGKPSQQITMDANMNLVTVHATVEFIPARRDNLIQRMDDNNQVIDNE